MTTVRDLTTVPLRSQPATFSQDMEYLLTNLPGWTGEVNAVAGEVNADKSTAVDSAATAVAKASEAVAAAAAAARDANAAQWVSGTTYTIGTVVWSPSNYLSYTRKTNGAGTTDPMSDPTNWAPRVPTQIYRQTRTSNTILARADDRAIIDITSGTFTQTFSACSTLGNGWSCIIRNSGNGDITLDPNSSETIDGLATYIMYPGETRLIQCDSSALRSVVLQGFSKTFTVSGTFTKPPGYSVFSGLLWGAGGSGGKSGTLTYSAGGGGGGACHPFTLDAAVVSSSVTVTIAAASTPGTVSGQDGYGGGNSSFGSTIYAYGGGAGQGSSIGHTYGGGGGGCLSAGAGGDAGGLPGGGTTNTSDGGGLGGASRGGSSGYGGAGGGGGVTGAGYAGGKSVYGGGGGGNAWTSPGAGGVSIHGGTGGAGVSAGNGTSGTAPGGGGGATQTGTQSGAGARGECRIWGIV